MDEYCRILRDAHNSVTEAKKGYKSTIRLVDQMEDAFRQINEEIEPMVAKLDKTAQDAVKTSINLLKAQIAQRNVDIEIACDCKKRQLENYKLYHKAIKSMGEQQSGDVDQCVGMIYCDGHDWLTKSIARWEEENKKAEAEIRKLEWDMKL